MLRTLHDSECIKRNFKYCACVEEVDFSAAALVQDGGNRCLFKCMRKISVEEKFEKKFKEQYDDCFPNDSDLVKKLPGFLREEVNRRDLNLMIPCQLQGKNVYAVADCGSMVSCISPEEVKRLNLTVRE